MKRKLNILFLSFLTLTGLASCQKENNTEDNKNSDGGLAILASTDGKLVPEWTEGDIIKVTCNGTSYNFKTETAGNSAKFTDDGTLTAQIIGNNAISAYYNCTSARGAFRISGEQTYKDGKSSAAIPMYAYTLNAPQNNTLALTFKPVASILRVTLPAHPISIESVSVKLAEGAALSEGAIAGTYIVNAAEGTIAVNADAESVDLTFDKPLDIKAGGVVDIPVGMFAASGGIEIALNYESTKQMKYVVDAEGVFKSYNDANGFKVGAIVPISFELDVNSFPRDYFVTSDATKEGKGLDWNTPATLDYALANALAGSTIHLAAGTYYPSAALPYSSEAEITASDALNGFEVKTNVTLIGGYPAKPVEGAAADASANATVLDGNSTSLHVMVVSAAKVAGEKVVIDGITIKNGKNTNEAKGLLLKYGTDEKSYTLVANYAAGLGIVNTDVELKNVTIASNSGDNGAGIFALGSKIKMTGCNVKENISAGNGAGAWFSGDTELEMDGCVIEKNDAGTSVVGGLYLHAPKDKTLSATIKNTEIIGNKAKNQGGFYIRDDSGAHLLSATFTSCKIKDNTAEMAAAGHHLDANVKYSRCEIAGNTGRSNGIFNIYDNCNIVLDQCSFRSNATTGGGGAIYVFTNSVDTTPSLTITNSSFIDNFANAKGTVWIRGDKGNVTFNCVNNTFCGNKTGNVGSAINLYKNVTANIISNTITGNIATYANDALRAGAICLEAAPLTVRSYNNIVAGNIRSFDNKEEDVKVKAGTIIHKYTFVGSQYYGADGNPAEVTPTFNYKTMLSAYSGSAIKLIGTAETNPAINNGMPAAALKGLANDFVTADILGKDQNGTVRAGSVAGACITQ